MISQNSQSQKKITKSEVHPQLEENLEEIESQQTAWKLRPSVGTWLMPVPHLPKCSADSAVTAAEPMTAPPVAPSFAQPVDPPAEQTADSQPASAKRKTAEGLRK